MKLFELFETPIADYQTFSDDPATSPTADSGKKAPIFKHPDDFKNRNSSFTDRRDKVLLTHPKAVERMKDMFANTDHDFYFYMVNSKEARKHAEIGFVDRDWLTRNMPSIEPHIPDNEDGITVIFTNNSGAEKVAMSPWIMAHRIGHAIARNQKSHAYTDADALIKRVTDQIFEEYYNYKQPSSGFRHYDDGAVDVRKKYSLLKKKFYEAIGTFRSARNNNIRQDFEFLNEIFAQWLVTKGGIKFNPVPQKIITRKAWGNDADGVYGRGDAEEANYQIEQMGDDLGYHFDNMMHEAANKIYVM
jgi:hypothetical protein